jgi:polyisoprenoid-binding protein YceI
MKPPGRLQASWIGATYSSTFIDERPGGIPMSRFASVLLAAALLAPSLAHADTWLIDPSHSAATFSVRHMMVSNVRGEFGKMVGTINYDPKSPTKATVEVTIDATSISTREPQRDQHLKSPDFFDVQKFPTITFKSTKVEQVAPGKLRLSGELTMHGVTKPVVLEVDGPSSPINAFGGTRWGASATSKVNRGDFGLRYNKALETGGVAVGEEVAITLDIEATKKVEQAAAKKK